MKSEILSTLRAAGGYLSGQQLCDKMGVSRTAMWKATNELKEEGYKIEVVCNRGYHLVENADMITQAELQSMLHSKWIGGRLEYSNETDFTNTRARKLAEEGTIHSILVAAGSQWANRDRRGGLWISPEGVGIWMSVVLRSAILPLHAPILTLTVGMVVIKGVRSPAGLNAMIKWSNNTVLEGKKICRILTEMSTGDECIRYVITEIGINVNIDEFSGEPAGAAISLKPEKGENTGRSPVISTVVEASEEYYDIFLEIRDMPILKEEYNRELANTNREVMVFDPRGQYEGTVLEIDNEGSLLVKKKDGTVTSVISGEVLMRGIYGCI